jgi:hypothetical protein
VTDAVSDLVKEGVSVTVAVKEGVGVQVLEDVWLLVWLGVCVMEVV